MDDYDYLFKVILIGDAGVGKTCIVRQFVQGLFPPGHASTIGVDFMIKTVVVGEDKVKLQIWDTAGQERFRAITSSFYKSADAIILVYDTTVLDSFQSLPGWLKEIDRYAKTSVLKYLVGNKTDQAALRVVDDVTGDAFAKQNKMPFMETSAKNSSNVEPLFMTIAETLTSRSKNSKLTSDETPMTSSIHLTHSVNTSPSCFGIVFDKNAATCFI